MQRIFGSNRLEDRAYAAFYFAFLVIVTI